MTASSLRPSSQRNRSAGGTTSATWRLREIAPFAVAAEHVVDDDIGPPGLVEARDDVRSDKSGPAGDQKHPCLAVVPMSAILCPTPPEARNRSASGRIKLYRLAQPGYRDRSGHSRNESVNTHRPRPRAAHPARALHVDRRFRALPLGRPACCAHAIPTGRSTCSPRRFARRLPSTCRACAKRIVVDLPRKRLGLRQQHDACRTAAGRRLRQALVMPRTWKSALAPMLAGIPRAHRLSRRAPLRSAQRHAPRRTKTARA